MSAIISMFIAVLIWSSYPYIAVVAMHDMSSLDLIFFSTLIASLTAAVISLIYFIKRNKLDTALENHKKLPKAAWIAIAASGLTHLMCNGLYFYALSISHKAGVSLVYESWPIIAVIATPFFIRKQWKAVSLQEFIVCFVALLGVIIVVLSNQQIEMSFEMKQDLSQKTDYMTLVGYILAFVGGYACALNIIAKAVVTESFKELGHDNGAIIISEFYSRSIAFIIMLLFLPFYFDALNFDNIQWWETFYVGFVVFILGGGFYTYSLIHTNSPTIHIFYYFVPLFAVIILWFFGESDVSTGLFLGGSLIVISNIYLQVFGRTKKFSQE